MSLKAPSRASMLRILTAVLCAPAAGGCAGLWQTPPSLPNRNAIVLNQLVVYSDFTLPRQHRLLEELTARRADLGEQLGLPNSAEPVYVYLFESADRFNAFMHSHYPDFPPRRAFFVETDTQLAVYAHWGDRVAEDLRHEMAHGYLHSVVPNVPLWLDEGLAEYFEVPRGQRGLNPSHIEEIPALLASGDWQPNLARLEQLTSASDMTQADYAESWAWVHFLLDTEPDRHELLRDFLRVLRKDGTAEPLSARLAATMPRPEESLVAHLTALAATAKTTQAGASQPGTPLPRPAGPRS
ncbi:MAG: DUF1570 domain-containing protein [Pirellulales bacterium]